MAVPPSLSEITGPLFGSERVGPLDDDLTRQHDGEPVGQRIIVHGRVLDGAGRPVAETLIEIWQALASVDTATSATDWPGSLDPNFTGAGRVVTHQDGRYRFVSVRPGAYPWLNHHNAWRPAHIHLSLFGRSFAQRLVTQMYFPDHDATEPVWALGFEFDVVLRGRSATPSRRANTAFAIARDVLREREADGCEEPER